MSSAGRVANISGCVARPRAREIGLIGFAAQIQRSSLTGSYVMETAEHREPCESRGSCTDLGAPGGEIPPGDSTITTEVNLEEFLLFPIADFAASHELSGYRRAGECQSVGVRTAALDGRNYYYSVLGFEFIKN